MAKVAAVPACSCRPAHVFRAGVCGRGGRALRPLAQAPRRAHRALLLAEIRTQAAEHRPADARQRDYRCRLAPRNPDDLKRLVVMEPASPAPLLPGSCPAFCAAYCGRASTCA